MASTGSDQKNNTTTTSHRDDSKNQNQDAPIADDVNPFIRFKQHVDAHVQRGFDHWSAVFSHPHHHNFTAWPTWQEQQQKQNQNQNHQQQSQSQRHQQDTSNASSSSSTFTPWSSFGQPQAPSHLKNPSSSGHGPGATPVHDLDGVLLWAVSSPYSPLNLQHLPQPAPRNGPKPGSRHDDDDDDAASFRHAFEDLLSSSSTSAAATGSPSRAGAGAGPLHVADWVADLQRRGLWPAYHPELRGAAPAPESPFSPGVLASLRALVPAHALHFTPRPERPAAAWPRWEFGSGGWGQMSKRQDKDAAASGRAGAGVEPGGLWAEGGRGHQARASHRQAPQDGEDGMPMHELELIARLLGFSLPPPQQQQQQQQPPPPYSATANPEEPEQMEPVSKRTTVHHPSERRGGQAETVEEEEELRYADGSRTVTTTTTSGSGGRVSVRRESFGPHGDVVAQSRETRIRKSFDWSWPSSAADEERRGSGSGSDGDEPRSGAAAADERGDKSGWFWTR